MTPWWPAFLFAPVAREVRAIGRFLYLTLWAPAALVMDRGMDYPPAAWMLLIGDCPGKAEPEPG